MGEHFLITRLCTSGDGVGVGVKQYRFPWHIMSAGLGRVLGFGGEDMQQLNERIQGWFGRVYDDGLNMIYVLGFETLQTELYA
jgi:hypothetical protein